MTPQPSPGEGPGLTDTDERVARAWNETAGAMSVEVVDCDRCGGHGYHHGFGEDGHDPDWCDKCGGAQYFPRYTPEQIDLACAQAARLALSPSPQESVYKGLLERLVAAYDDPGGDMAEEAFRVVHEMKALATEEPTT